MNSNPVRQEPYWYDCINAATTVQDIASFKVWTRNFVRPLLPHSALACVHGITYGVGVALDFVLTVDYPLEHLAAIRNKSGHMDTPLAQRWNKIRSPVFFDESSIGPDIPAQWLQHFRQHKLINAAADGVFDSDNCIATYFSFHRLPQINQTRLKQTFKTLTPLLHQTYVRV
ncbi:MAG: helix-turn-helix transcriptional regulator, partial [Undibacterium sp.]|nr:helix-turn-helix transcriptional regulator [Undibacterium sp.]